MVKSMTGFGRYEAVGEERKVIVEMKSVNHRYSDISVKLPKRLSFFDTAIRNVLKDYVSRGKVDVFVTFEDYSQSNITVKYNKDIALDYWKNINQLANTVRMENDVTVSQLSRYPEVFTLEENRLDEDATWVELKEAVEIAAQRFVESRIAEGANLQKDIISKTEKLLSLVSYVEERSPKMLEEHKNRLYRKVQETLGDKQIDESVLATELIIYADKVCVDEETVRLRSHILNLRDTMQEGENVGRKLDFIAQEMNREANTILSKANDIEISNCAIDLKTEIEKIREQIQNIE
ncbi:MAG: YicC family protein [Lachnospiraceae bacterium]|nr:YicC family protein [Lachnospiraceae bacterium]